MSIFRNIFGIESSLVHKNCVLAPCLNKDLLAAFGVKDIARGKLYGCAQGDDFTLIHARVGACFIGDVVLYLKETACSQVFLFGSCGSTGVLDIGCLVMPVKCFGRESFSSLLHGTDQMPCPVFYPDKRLSENFYESLKGIHVDKVVCMTLPSLKLEEELAGHFRDGAVDVVEMECSAFFSAASKVGLPAAGLFYTADIIHKKPFYADLSVSDQEAMKTGMLAGIKALCDYMKKSSNG